jgi:hypothetical protein
MISQNVTAPRRKNYDHSLTLFVALVPFRWKTRFDSVQLTNQYGFAVEKSLSYRALSYVIYLLNVPSRKRKLTNNE